MRRLKPETMPLAPKRRLALALAQAGLALALCLLCLFFFRGVLSLLGALLIPLILSMGTWALPLKLRVSLGLALLLSTLIFFPAQLVFVLIYLGMAWLLVQSEKLKLKKSLQLILYIVLLALLFDLGLILTQRLFSTPLRSVYLSALGLAYPGLLLLQAGLVGGLQAIILKVYQKRIRPRQRQARLPERRNP